MIFFAALILAVMALRLWTMSNANKNESGICYDSKTSMREFLSAVLEDNPKNERIVGLTDNDIVELFE